jgi:hypothetical protein
MTPKATNSPASLIRRGFFYFVHPTAGRVEYFSRRASERERGSLFGANSLDAGITPTIAPRWRNIP